MNEYWKNEATLVDRRNGQAVLSNFLQVLQNWSSDPEENTVELTDQVFRTLPEYMVQVQQLVTHAEDGGFDVPEEDADVDAVQNQIPASESDDSDHSFEDIDANEPVMPNLPRAVPEEVANFVDNVHVPETPDHGETSNDGNNHYLRRKQPKR